MPPLFFKFNYQASLNFMMRKKAAIALFLVFAVFLVGFFFAGPTTFHSHETTQANKLPSISKSATNKSWVCPMHPEISQDHPGTCPICGMKLVESSTSGASEHSVHVDNATLQRLGVRLAYVTQGIIGEEVRTYGNIVLAENLVFAIQPKYEGWIKKLYVHSVGEKVRAGQVLYEIYSPELVARQRTYLSNIERRKQLLQTIPTTPDTENEYVMEMAMDAAEDRKKLHVEEGVSVESIKAIEEKKQASDVVQIISEHSGIVSQINIKEGSFVTQATPILVLSDVSKVWVDVVLYPDQVGQVSAGDAVAIKDSSGKITHSRLNFINPLATSNKVYARVELENASQHLRPGTYVDVTITSRPHEALLLARAAVIYTGQGSMVMLSRGDGHFLPVPVETGAERGEWVEIVDGLQKGSEVALNGQFLLDSAASMSATIERMRAN